MNWRGAAFVVVERAARLLERSGRALRCAGAGLLDRAELRRQIERSWAGFYASERDVRSGLMEWEREIYGRFLRPEDRILLVGSGTGRDLIALLQQGSRVEALELSERAATFARAMLVKSGVATTVRVGAVEDADLGGPWDAVVFAWGCYGYIPGAELRVRTLRRAGTTLAPGGRVIVNILPGFTATSPAPLAIMRAAARLSRSDWYPERGDYVDHQRNGLHFEHHFATGEIEREAARAGLAVAFLSADGTSAVLVPAAATAAAR